MRGETLAAMLRTLTLTLAAPTDLRHAFAARSFAVTVYRPLIYHFAPASNDARPAGEHGVGSVSDRR